MDGVASRMIHSGLPFILTIYSMHLMYTLYRQRYQKKEYLMMDMGEEKMEKECGKNTMDYQSII